MLNSDKKMLVKKRLLAILSSRVETSLRGVLECNTNRLPHFRQTNETLDSGEKKKERKKEPKQENIPLAAAPAAGCSNTVKKRLCLD